ncbi:MAG: hypothetical protein K1X75_09870 [Leptospirales bacterium]|nr:hypothetical protein [Leptospirales bacterium]
MCGISLLLSADGPRRNLRIQSMHQALLHRGMEDGLAMQVAFAGAVRRLPIVDLHLSRQPMQFENGRYVFLYNGEVYNYRSLRDGLRRQRGLNFVTEGDTEVLALGLIHEGLPFLSAIQGQFACALVDTARGEVLLARDAFGIKPLYFQAGDGEFVVASEYRAFDQQRDIHALPPGAWLRASERGLEDSGQWFDLVDFSKRSATTLSHLTGADQWASELRRRLEAAVSARLDPQLPAAVIYSGGLDSSIVLELCRRQRPDTIAVTIGAPDSEDMLSAARFCQERGIRHLRIQARAITRATVRRAVEQSELGEYGDLINAAVCAPLFHAIHNEGLRIALCGDGSDELFAGYDMYARAADPAAEQALRLYKLAQLHRTELQRVDRMGMAATVEVRTPFLDLKVAELALALPYPLRHGTGREKEILRRAFAELLPDYILNRKKNPLSHSSGLHESVRFWRPLFPRWRKRSSGEALRRDFSATLRRCHFDLGLAAAEAQKARDYSALEKLRDFGGALFHKLRR